MKQPLTEKDFPQYLNSISDEQWSKLFDLFPEIKATKDFGQLAEPEEISKGVYSFPHYNYSDIAMKFLNVVYDLNLIINFNWMEWKEGIHILKTEPQRFDALDSLTLCKLITIIVRGDRFNEGLLISKFNNGTILKILEALNFQVIKNR